MPKRELSTEEIAHPEKVFYTGQVVKCHVLSWNTDKGTLTLSFKVGNALCIMYQQRSTFRVLFSFRVFGTVSSVSLYLYNILQLYLVFLMKSQKIGSSMVQN